MNNFALMARFNEWANRRLYGAVAALTDEAYRADRGLFFGSVHRTLNHILVVDRIWTRRIDGEPHGIPSLDTQLHEGFAELSRAREEEDQRLIGQVDALGEERLRQPVRYQRIIGSGEAETRCDHVLLTLFNHQTHHRGQVHAALPVGHRAAAAGRRFFPDRAARACRRLRRGEPGRAGPVALAHPKHREARDDRQDRLQGRRQEA